MTDAIGLHRDRWHRYVWNGEPKVPGITSVIKMLDKSDVMTGWAKREVAIAAIRNFEALQKMVDGPVPESALRGHPAVAFLKAIPGYQRDAAADLGTKVHAAAEGLVQGQEAAVDDATRPFAESYVKGFVEKYKPVTHPSYIEAMVYHPGDGSIVLPYGGTMDLFCRIGDDLWLVDIKTSASGVYPETALQLAAGRFAGWIGRPGDPKRYPIPQATKFGAVHCRPEETELRPYDVTPQEFQAFAACRLLWHWKHERSEEVMTA